jgi:cellulose synthase/poly-beta-1,6-N-acetylglucosamine synthase-like glycosyltransferase
VVERLIDAVASLDYPRDRLQIQVLDDSTDRTTALARARVRHHRTVGLDISLLHRTQRDGFKAGALQRGLGSAFGEFIAIFDADFHPQPHFLLHVIPHLQQDPRLGMVQTRWGHLNAGYNALTRAQAIALDKHFAVEQLVRHQADLFPRFNGSGGVWRQRCLVEVGGWQGDTVCEDLDVSIRAQLAGWRFRFLPEEVSPAELPPHLTAYKMQQARWAKGSLQCVLKYGRAILRSQQHTMAARLYALISMTGYTAHLLLLAMLLLLPLLLLDGYRFSPFLAAFGLAGIAQPLLFVLSQRVLFRDWGRRTLTGLPALALIAVGLAPSNALAIWKALARRPAVFDRTPKYNQVSLPGGCWSAYPMPSVVGSGRNHLALCEASLTVYALLGAGVALARGSWGSLPFLLLCAGGLGYTAVMGFRETRVRGRRLPRGTETRKRTLSKRQDWRTAIAREDG